MTPTTSIRVVAFDLMDTVLTDPFREALRAASGREPADLFALRDPEIYPALERGEIDEQEYWDHFRARGVPIDSDAFHAVRRAGIDYIDGMDTLLDGLAGAVIRVTASNYPRWLEELVPTVLSARFEHVFASYNLGARKPDSRFYARLVDALGCAPEQVAFVDDRAPNVAAAREFGMPAREFVDACDLAAWLASLGISVAARQL